MYRAQRSRVALFSNRAVVLRSEARLDGALRAGGRIGNGNAPRGACDLKTGPSWCLQSY
jgi:hypothetical protein